MIGTTLNHYRITGKLGEGGMGEVYRATDTKLGREVAIKVLPASINRDPQSLARFEREAKALAALNHPHIAGIHGFEADQGTHFLVLELVEGETLRERLRRGPLPIKEALTVVRQMAEAIQEAHEKGVIHRDLKPGNVKITPNGRVKVLDFGLAKIEQTFRGESGSGTAPAVDPKAATIQSDRTHPGAVMGTPAYMSPEQARGQEVDKRTDIWAFGCCLFECLAGQKPFRGQTTSDLVAEVLKGDPDWSQIPAETPREVVTLLRRCLEKEPSRRLSSMGDIAITLEDSTRGPALSEAHLPHGLSSRPAPSNGISTKVLWPMVTGLVVLMIGATTVILMRSGSKGQPQIGGGGGKTNDAPASVAVSTADQKSVAVLPFVNMSAEKADEYLSDGMTEELLNVLAKMKGLRVPGRSSSFAFKGKTEDGIFRKVGEQLHVATVLEGSVRKSGNQLRITAQLINVADGFHLWSETYDRDMSNIFAIQSDIAGRVAQALKLQLLGTVDHRKQSTENIEAYKLYLQGRQLWNRRTGESVKQALKYFEEAISKDPDYVLAYAGLADCYVSLPMYAGISLREAVPKLRAAAMKALELDDSLAEPHAALADVKANFEWDWAGAEAEFRQAIALNPNYSPARYWLVASVLRPQRRFDEALVEIQRAQELDPLSLIVNLNLGESLSLVGRSELGIQVLQKQIAFDPSFLPARAALAAAYYSADKLPEALAELETMHRLDASGTHRLDYLGFVYARAGRTNEARNILGQLEELQRQGFDNRVGIAIVQHGLGDDEDALASLEQAADDRGFGLKFVNHEPFWRELRPNSRVQAILKRMKLVK